MSLDKSINKNNINKNNINKNIERRKENAVNNIENGYYLSKLRNKVGLRLIDVADKLGLNNASFLSDIERGRKVPNEELLRKLSVIYGVDEIEFSSRFGKISFTVIEGLIEDKGLHRRVWEMVKWKGCVNKN